MSTVQKPTHDGQISAQQGQNPVQLTLLEQRLACRAQLAKQRQVIAFQLSPKLALTHEELNASKYPRSLTMRFFSQNPAPAFSMILRLATMVVGARASGVLSTGLQIYRMFRAGKT
jgi:hypothetical protein